jgi:hypothetical protein
MANAREQMNMIDKELQEIEDKIGRLEAQREVLIKLKKSMNGEVSEVTTRKRAPNIKPLVLDIMSNVGEFGATSAEVDAKVRQTTPSVAKDTVGSVLSRLKADGALVYDGIRYYEKRYAPLPPTIEPLRSVI